MENRFRVYLWNHYTEIKTVGEIIHGPGATKLLTTNGRLCFGNRKKINDYLATEIYAERMPLIPRESFMHLQSFTLTILR